MVLEASLAGRTQARALDLCEMLYPDEDEVRALRALKQLVFQVCAQFRPSVVVTTPNGYALGAVTSDAASFLETGNTALWRGLYLEDTESRDESVRGRLYDTLKGRVADLLGEDPAEAARAGYLLIEAEPYDPEVLRLTLLALQHLGGGAELERVYRKGCLRLLEVGVVLPAEAKAFLASSTF